MRHTDTGLYNVIEKILREKGVAMDCVELFSFPEVKVHADSVNRVSDYLGGLWRKKLVTRLVSDNKNGHTRWKYQINEKVPVGVQGITYAPKLLVDRPTLIISEEGKTMQIETPSLTILIKQK